MVNILIEDRNQEGENMKYNLLYDMTDFSLFFILFIHFTITLLQFHPKCLIRASEDIYKYFTN